MEMFYEEIQINENLICDICKKVFDEPRILPCGETFCSKCIHLMAKPKGTTDDENFLLCSACSEMHPVPKTGFPLNKQIIRLINQKPKVFNRGAQAETLKTNLVQITNELNEFNQKIKSKTDIIKDYCENIKSDVDLVTESAKEYINKFNKSFIEQINNYRDNCIERMLSDNDYNEKLDKFLKDSSKFLEGWNTYLKQSEIDENKIKKANQDAVKLKQRLEIEKNNFKKYLFDGKYLCYKENPVEITSAILGTLVHKKIGIHKFSDMEKLDFRFFLQNKHHACNKMIIEMLENGNFAVAYYNPSGYTNIAIHNSSGGLIKLAQESSGFDYIKFTHFKNELFVSSYTGQYFISVYDENLMKKSYSSIPFDVISLAANSNGILCLVNSSNPQLNFYTHSIVLYMTLFPCESAFIPRGISHLRAFDSNKYLLKHDKCISVLDMEDGISIRTLEIPCTFFRINNAKDQIVCFNQDQKLLSYYTITGDKLTENELKDFDFNPLTFLIDYDDNLIFVDANNLCIYR